MKSIFTSILMISILTVSTSAFTKGGHDFNQKPVEVSRQELKVELLTKEGQKTRAYLVTYECPEGFRPKDGQCKKKHFWNK